MATPLHPLFVHLPIALALLMPFLAGGLWLALVRSWLPPRAWILATGAQLLLVASGWLAIRSGEADEDRVERFVPEAAIEQHEAAAEAFVLGAAAVFLLSLTPLLWRRHPRLCHGLAAATSVAALGVLALGYRVGKAGGELVYRHGAAAAFTTSAGQPAAVPPVGHRDDDER